MGENSPLSLCCQWVPPYGIMVRHLTPVVFVVMGKIAPALLHRTWRPRPADLCRVCPLALPQASRVFSKQRPHALRQFDEFCLHCRTHREVFVWMRRTENFFTSNPTRSMAWMSRINRLNRPGLAISVVAAARCHGCHYL